MDQEPEPEEGEAAVSEVAAFVAASQEAPVYLADAMANLAMEIMVRELGYVRAMCWVSRGMLAMAEEGWKLDRELLGGRTN